MLKAEIKNEFQGENSTPFPIRCLTQWKASWEANYTEVISSISYGKDAWATVFVFCFFSLHSAAVCQKVLQCPVKSDNEGRVNAQWKINNFSSKSTSFLGISNIIMTYKSHSIIFETSYSKIMTAVTSHFCLSGLIGKMPPGSAKDIVMQLYKQTDWSASLCLQILYFSVYFIFGLE